MALVAHKVLKDCKLALAMLEEEQDLNRWRIIWAGALALLRAVGHVLHKVDGEDARIKIAATNAFNRWRSDAPEHEIFREFVERERNSLLKEYSVNVHPDEEVRIAFDIALESTETGERRVVTEEYPIGDNIYRPLLDGFRIGDDARDVLSDAIEWWEAQLAEIERVISAPTVTT